MKRIEFILNVICHFAALYMVLNFVTFGFISEQIYFAFHPFVSAFYFEHHHTMMPVVLPTIIGLIVMLITDRVAYLIGLKEDKKLYLSV